MTWENSAAMSWMEMLHQINYMLLHGINND